METRHSFDILVTHTKPQFLNSLKCASNGSFWYFWLTIHNTTISQAHSLFGVAGVFISFCPWRASVAAAAAVDFFCCCCARPLPIPPPFLEGEGTKKKKIACSVGVGASTCLRRLGRGGRGRGRGMLVALYVKGVLRYRTRSSAHKARTRVLGFYGCAPWRHEVELIQRLWRLCVWRL